MSERAYAWMICSKKYKDLRFAETPRRASLTGGGLLHTEITYLIEVTLRLPYTSAFRNSSGIHIQSIFRDRCFICQILIIFQVYCEVAALAL